MLGKACNVVVVPEIRYTMRYVGYRSPPPKTSRHRQGVSADQVSISLSAAPEKNKNWSGKKAIVGKSSGVVPYQSAPYYECVRLQSPS